MLRRQGTEDFVAQESVVADHDVEWRAQLVRHGGEELRLQPIGALQIFDEASILQDQGGEVSDAAGDAFLFARERRGALTKGGGVHAYEFVAAFERNIQHACQSKTRRQGRPRRGRIGHRHLQDLMVPQLVDQSSDRPPGQSEGAHGFPLLRQQTGGGHGNGHVFARLSYERIAAFAAQHLR